MNPDDRQRSQSGGQPQPSLPAQKASVTPQTTEQREAAANVIRSSLEHLYDHNGHPKPTDTSEPAENSNPYLRTREEAPVHQLSGTVEEQWKAYHTAWQTYYQQYYETYYHHAKQPKNDHSASGAGDGYFSDPAMSVSDAETMTKDEALHDLRERLLQRVTQSAKKVRKSRHFVPILAAVIVVLAFAFVQYNKVLIGTVAAYVSPGSMDPQDIVIDPNSNVQVTQDPRLIIPKINVDVPVLYDVGNDYDSQMNAMKSGVAHFSIPGASSHPGEIGNTAVAGHSSNDLFDSGDYKFIFAQLEKLRVGDTFYANYKGIRYTYVITETKVVAPTDIQALVQPTTKPIMTLITCTPLGTSLNRLLVVGEQISPDPAAATQPTSTNTQATTLSGANAPSLFERLFGAR